MTMNDRRRALMGVRGSDTPILPVEYQQLEWLQSYYYEPATDNYIINTNQLATYQTELEMVVASVGDVTAPGRSFISARPSNTGATNAFMIASFSAAQKFGFGYFGTWYQAIARDNDFHKYIVSNANLSVDGVSYGTPSVASGDTTRTLWIFGENGSSRFAGRPQKMKYIKITQNGVLGFHGIPCYRKSDGKNGFYDLVSNSLFSCSGANQFTRGPEL